MQAIKKLLDIARNRRKMSKKEKENRKMRKSQTTTINKFFTFTFNIEKFIFVRKHIWKNLVYIVTFVLVFSAWQVTRNAVKI